jgi:hypothetical protein
MSNVTNPTCVFGFTAHKEDVLEELKEELAAGFTMNAEEQKSWEAMTFYTCAVGIVYLDGTYEDKITFDNDDQALRGKEGYSWQAAKRHADKWSKRLGGSVVSALYLSDAIKEAKA